MCTRKPKNLVICLIAIVTLFLRSRTKPMVSLRPACILLILQKMKCKQDFFCKKKKFFSVLSLCCTVYLNVETKDLESFSFPEISKFI